MAGYPGVDRRQRLNDLLSKVPEERHQQCIDLFINALAIRVQDLDWENALTVVKTAEYLCHNDID